jgi:hypothetical protein
LQIYTGYGCVEYPKAGALSRRPHPRIFEGTTKSNRLKSRLPAEARHEQTAR